MASRTKHRTPHQRKAALPLKKSWLLSGTKLSPYYRAGEDDADEFPSPPRSPALKKMRSREVQPPSSELSGPDAALGATTSTRQGGADLGPADRLTQTPHNRRASLVLRNFPSFFDILNSARSGDIDTPEGSTTPSTIKELVHAPEPEPERELLRSPSSADMRHIPRSERVKRWDPANQTVSGWDGLRKDSELWIPEGDCLIHLYPKGQSRRGPSFCVPFRALREARCGALMGLCSSKPVEDDSAQCLKNHRYSMCTETAGQLHLYLPAPDFVTKDEAFQWHLTTRNFFAFVCGRPLVGAHLGKAFVDLHERMQTYRKHIVDNDDDILEYADAMGYTNFVNCPDYALAMLYYAEHFQVKDIWIDAFAHCVGMNHTLSLSDEFSHISRVTKTLINKAFLEIDVHIGKVSKAVKSFLEDEMSSANLGIPQGSRDHLDRFRSFLYSYYVEKYGFWPPREFKGYPKELFKTMYFDFRNLYEYLVDLNSTESIQDQRPTSSGGLCVLQNITTFNRKHGLAPLPYPLPLIPQINDDEKPHHTHKALATLKFHGMRNAKAEKSFQIRTALATATNSSNLSVAGSPLVRAYARFERDLPLKMEEKVSTADARKVRWILIYGTLQMLISVIRAPPEVRDTENADYPLCVLAGAVPWIEEKAKSQTPSTSSSESLPSLEAAQSGSSSSSELDSPSTIQPDYDFDSHFPRDVHDVSNTSVSVPQDFPVEMPAPLRVHPLLRSASPKAGPLPLFSSFRNSIKRQVSSRQSQHPALTLDELIAGRDLDTSIARTTSSEDLDGMLYSLNYKDAPAAEPPSTQLPTKTKLSKRPAMLNLHKSKGFENGTYIKFATSPLLPQTPLSPLSPAVFSTTSEADTDASSIGQSTPGKEISDPLEAFRQNQQEEEVKPEKDVNEEVSRIERPSSAASSIYSPTLEKSVEESEQTEEIPVTVCVTEPEEKAASDEKPAEEELERPATAVKVEAPAVINDPVLFGYAEAKRKEVMNFYDAFSMGPFRGGIAA